MKRTVFILFSLHSFAFVLSDNLGNMNYDGYEYTYFNSGSDSVSFCVAGIKCSVYRPGKGILAKVTSKDLNDELAELAGFNAVWIGGTDMQGEGYWVWEDGTPITWSNWYPGEPNDNKGEDCIELNHGAEQWNDEDCGDNRGFLCQAKSDAARAFDYSEFTIIKPEESLLTFADAKERCKNIGARLPYVSDEENAEILLQKLRSNGIGKFWVETEDVSSCAIVGDDGTAKIDCNEVGYEIACETVAPHYLQVSNESPVITETEELRIDCTASGFPTPKVAWYRDDEKVSNQIFGDGSSTLVINNAEQKDEGKYRCFATNGIGHQTRGFTVVTVRAKEDQ